MIQPSTLTTWLHEAYALDGRVTSELLRAYTNDVYLIRTSDDSYILKLYGVGWRTEAEIQYEVALLDHLAKKSLRVANTVAGKDGQNIYQTPTPEGQRYAVLFEYAEGEKPQPPFSDELYFAFGEAIARMHTLSDDFDSAYGGSPLNVATVIDIPANLALPLIENAEDRRFLQATAQKVRDRLTEPDAGELDWGPIHGDATLDNLHVIGDGQITLYDFDTGGPGWRAADLQGWAKNNDEYAGKWAAYKAGYASVRELKAIDLEAAPYLAVAWLIWGLQVDLERRILAQGREEIRAYLREEIEALRHQARLAFE